jgi:hypothetical protein
MMTEEVPHGYVTVFQTMIYFIDQSYMKPSEEKPVFQAEVNLKSSITLSMMKSRKEKVVLQYISPQMSR